MSVSSLRQLDPAVNSIGGKVGCSAWLPEADRPRAVVLVGHGGSQFRQSPSVLALVERLAGQAPVAVAAIDGPIHGDRQPDPAISPKQRQRKFLELWETGDGCVDAMVADWKAALDELLSLREIGDVPVGYAGISMGTAYGVPLLAAEPRIEAAVLGMWSANYTASERLAEAASRIICPVLFISRRQDEIFDSAGIRRLYDALACEDRRFLELPGAHVETDEQFDQTATFLSARLLRENADAD